MNSLSLQLICHSWDESSSAQSAMYTVDQKRRGSLWHASSHTRHEYRGDQTDFMVDIRSRTLRSNTAQTHFSLTQMQRQPPHPHTRVSHYCFALPGRLLPGLRMSELIGRPCSSPKELTSWIGWFHKGSFSRCFPFSSCTNRWITHYSPLSPHTASPI